LKTLKLPQTVKIKPVGVMLIRLLGIVFILFIGSSPVLGSTKFHKVPALPGDGIFSLLRRYQLDQHSCNHQQFYKLNKLQEKSGLKVGRYYYIPIILYDFNGKTIRSSIGIDNWNLAKKIETYNDEMTKDGYRKQAFKQDRVLWVPYHLLNCPDEDIPAAEVEDPEPPNGGPNLATAKGGNRRFAIFGKEYEHVPLESNKLAGRVYYIVSGHGGPDPGAMGKKSKYSLCEDEYAYDVALRLARNLLAHGAIAYMIVRDPDDGIRDEEILKCDYDEVVWGNKKISRNQKARLTQRSDVINELYEKHKKQGVKNQQAIIIHVDSRSKSQQTDIFFYYSKASTASKNLAYHLHKTIERKYRIAQGAGRYKGTVSARDLHMLRETKPTSVYIELGNIRNDSDQRRIVIRNNRQALANWLMDGLIK
jgi:N-acetylmuramoyl-L-alanine amidase